MLTLQSKHEKEKKCPKCGEIEKVVFLGPADYFRKPNGDYLREMGYQCEKCKEIFLII